MNKIEINSVVNVGSSGFLKRVKLGDNIELNTHWVLASDTKQELTNKEIRKHNKKLWNNFLIS